MRHELNAREYKLLLDPSKFTQPLSKDSANNFWYGQVVPVIAEQLDLRDGSSRAEAPFGSLVKRNVRFWDARDCTLTLADFALRTRSDVQHQAQMSDRQEVTLKLRMADYFVVANTVLPGRNGDAKTKFEEDIAPLEVKPGPTSTVVFPVRHSIRSRYSLSTTQDAGWSAASSTVGRVRRLFPTLEGLLRQPFASGDDEVLVGGPVITELAVKGARVRLGENVTGDFTLTFWYFGPAEGSPAVAEVSYKCDTIEGRIPGNVARRAFDLFVGLQTAPGGYVNTDHSSKTAMALPNACAALG
jgi:hypothetical protein